MQVTKKDLLLLEVSMFGCLNRLKCKVSVSTCAKTSELVAQAEYISVRPSVSLHGVITIIRGAVGYLFYCALSIKVHYFLYQIPVHVFAINNCIQAQGEKWAKCSLREFLSGPTNGTRWGVRIEGLRLKGERSQARKPCLSN
jgi:hypothetical protein